jgi:hypothetical protein
VNWEWNENDGRKQVLLMLKYYCVIKKKPQNAAFFALFFFFFFPFYIPHAFWFFLLYIRVSACDKKGKKNFI